MALALAVAPSLAQDSPDSEGSAHLLIGMTPGQGFEVTCEDSVLYLDPVVADELGIMEFHVQGRFGPNPNTICVRIPAPPQVSEEHATDVSDKTAIIAWSTDRPATSRVEYGLTSSYGYSTPDAPGLVVDHAVGLEELVPETTYHYRVVSTDAFGNTTVGTDMSFTTLPPGATLWDVRAESVTGSSFVAVWETSAPCNSQVEYGLSPAYGSESPLHPEFVTEHAVAVNDLIPNTTYHYRVVSVDDLGRTVCSDNQVVTTLEGELAMYDVAISDTTSTGAVVSWRTTNPATSWVVYGETPEYGNSAGGDTMSTTHSVVLSGLLPGTIYMLYAFSVDDAGASIESEGLQFRTRCAPLEMSGPHVASSTCTSVTLSWTTAAPADGRVEYGPDESYGQVAIGDTALTLGHVVEITGLEPAREYHMRAISSDADGCTAVSPDLEVSTETPELLVLSPEVPETTATSATVTWLTSNPSRCYVEYGTSTSYGFETEPGAFHLVEHSVVLNDLAPRTLYHFRVHAEDVYGQSLFSTDATFATPDQNGPAGLLVHGVVARQISPTHTLICWQTNVPASSTVHYGTTEACELAVSDDALITDHCLTLAGLTSNTRYYYWVTSTGAAGLSADSQLYSFVTPSVDHLPPGAPVGINAAPCVAGVHLAWQRGPEYDLATYRVYRRSDGLQSFTLMAELDDAVTSYVDRNALDGWDYAYAVSALDASGNESQLSQIVLATAGLSENGHVWVYPNPVTEKSTTISFSAPRGEGEECAVMIYDARGRLVRTIRGGQLSGRSSSVSWNTRDNTNNPVSSGIYFCVVSFPEETLRAKIMVLR